MPDPKPGEIIYDGGNVTIGAPPAKAEQKPAPKEATR